MHAEHRGRDGLKGSVGDRAKNVGVLVAGIGLVCMVLGAAFGFGVEPLLTARWDRAILRQIEAKAPRSTSDADGPVLLMGRIDPRQPVPVGGGGLALLERESWRINWTWGLELIHHPEFDLVLADRSVRVVNGCRRQESDWRGRLFNASRGPGLGLDDCYRLGWMWVVAYDGSGHRRVRGFRPGDDVYVVGILHGDQLHATSVFGGSPEDYAATLRHSPWPVIVGLVLGLALVAGSVMIGYMVLCSTRRPAGPPARGPAPGTGG